jgi:hypothetical protein
MANDERQSAFSPFCIFVNLNGDNMAEQSKKNMENSKTV